MYIFIYIYIYVFLFLYIDNIYKLSFDGTGGQFQVLGWRGFWRLLSRQVVFHPSTMDFGSALLSCECHELVVGKVLVESCCYVSVFFWFPCSIIDLAGSFFKKKIIPVWGRFPCWLIFFNWVETTNQWFFAHLNSCGPFFLKNHVLGSFWLEHVGLKSHIGFQCFQAFKGWIHSNCEVTVVISNQTFPMWWIYPIPPPCAKLPNRGTLKKQMPSCTTSRVRNLGNHCPNPKLPSCSSSLRLQ